MSGDEDCGPESPLHFFVHRVVGIAAREGRFSHDTEFGSIPLDPAALRDPLTIQFDTARNRLEALAGGYCEPDGAWGWNSPDGRTRVGGTLHAFDERLICVEAIGMLADPDWDQWLQLLDLPTADTIVQLVEQGRFLTSAAFRKWVNRRK